MKKFVLILLALTLVLCLVGCENPSENYRGKVDTSSTPGENIFVWTDEETGVQYIVYREKYGYAGMGGITPRLNVDGTLYTEEGK